MIVGKLDFAEEFDHEGELEVELDHSMGYSYAWLSRAEVEMLRDHLNRLLEEPAR